jgi:hypothetical protein
MNVGLLVGLFKTGITIATTFAAATIATKTYQLQKRQGCVNAELSIAM